MNFFFENLSLVPETSAAMGHFKLVSGSGTSDPAQIWPLKNWHLPDFLSGFALWNFASACVLYFSHAALRARSSLGTLARAYLLSSIRTAVSAAVCMPIEGGCRREQLRRRLGELIPPVMKEGNFWYSTSGPVSFSCVNPYLKRTVVNFRIAVNKNNIR